MPSIHGHSLFTVASRMRIGLVEKQEKLTASMAYCSVTSTPQRFSNCLSNFQLQDLLVLKKSLEIMNYTESQNENVVDVISSCNDTATNPQRMALMSADRSDRGSLVSAPSQSWQSDHTSTWVEEKPSKLQTLFQISITALAFLSFGGYLLCLIVQAIKSKGTTYFHPVATAMTTSTNGNVKRIKIYRRSKRTTNSHIPNSIFPDYVTYMRAIRGQEMGHAHLVGS